MTSAWNFVVPYYARLATKSQENSHRVTFWNNQHLGVKTLKIWNFVLTVLQNHVCARRFLFTFFIFTLSWFLPKIRPTNVHLLTLWAPPPPPPHTHTHPKRPVEVQRGRCEYTMERVILALAHVFRHLLACFPINTFLSSYITMTVGEIIELKIRPRSN